MKDFPRRNQLHKCTPAELAIFNAIEEVEKVGANVMLTNAIMKLQEAKEFVSDVVDGIDYSQTKDQSSKVCSSGEDKDLKRFCINHSVNLVQSGLVNTEDVIEQAKKFYSYINE